MAPKQIPSPPYLPVLQSHSKCRVSSPVNTVSFQTSIKHRKHLYSNISTAQTLDSMSLVLLQANFCNFWNKPPPVFLAAKSTKSWSAQSILIVAFIRNFESSETSTALGACPPFFFVSEHSPSPRQPAYHGKSWLQGKHIPFPSPGTLQQVHITSSWITQRWKVNKEETKKDSEKI